MPDIFFTMLYFVAIIPLTYFCYTLLTIFDYTKILRRGCTNQLKVLLMLISVGIAYLVTSAFFEIIERIYNLFI